MSIPATYNEVDDEINGCIELEYYSCVTSYGPSIISKERRAIRANLQ